MEKRKILTIAVCLLLVLVVFTAGCSDSGDSGGNDTDDGDTDDGDTNGGGDTGLSGTSTYSGDWEGTVGGEQYKGTLQLEADFDAGTITGNFTGDASGDIQGTVSGGTIDADGTAGFGTVVWSGDFTSDGADVDGNWELEESAPYDGSGTWQATEE